MTLSLNPDYYLSWDIKRIILYSKKQCVHEADAEWVSYIHPLHAFIIGTLSLEHDIEKAISTILKRIPINKKFIEEFIYSIIENKQPCHIESAKGNVSFPRNLLLKGDLHHPQGNIQDIIQKSLSINDIDLQTLRLFHHPIKIIWMLNNKCAVHCTYCYADILHKCNEIPFNKFQEVIENCKKENMQDIEIIGGDFFVKKEWNKYLKCLINNNFIPPFISTKKTLTANEIEQLIKTGYSGILQFSLDSLSQEKLNIIIHSPSGYIDKVKKMFYYLAKKEQLPFKVRISTVLTQYNANSETIQEIYSFLETLNLIDEWGIRFAMPSFNQSKDFVCSDEDVKIITDYIHKFKSNISSIPISFIEHDQLTPTHNVFWQSPTNIIIDVRQIYATALYCQMEKLHCVKDYTGIPILL